MRKANRNRVDRRSRVTLPPPLPGQVGGQRRARAVHRRGAQGVAGPHHGRTRPEPFNPTPMAVNSISSGPPHVLRAHTGVHRTCGEPDEIKKNTHPKRFTALCRREQDLTSIEHGNTAGWTPSTNPVALHWVSKREVLSFGWVFSLISLGGQAPHVNVRPMWALSTCGEPNETELAAAHGLVCRCFPGRRQALERQAGQHQGVRGLHRARVSTKRAVIPFGWALFLVSLGGQAPRVLRAHMGAYVRRAE